MGAGWLTCVVLEWTCWRACGWQCWGEIAFQHEKLSVENAGLRVVELFDAGAMLDFRGATLIFPLWMLLCSPDSGLSISMLEGIPSVDAAVLSDSTLGIAMLECGPSEEMLVAPEEVLVPRRSAFVNSHSGLIGSSTDHRCKSI